MFSILLCVSHSVVPDSFATPWTAIHQVPLSMRYSRQGYWSGLPFPSPGDLPNPGIEPGSSALQANSLPAELQGKITHLFIHSIVDRDVSILWLLGWELLWTLLCVSFGVHMCAFALYSLIMPSKQLEEFFGPWSFSLSGFGGFST